MRKLLLIAVLLVTPATQAQTMYEAMRSQWHLFVFVSTGMPRESLIQAARDAQKANAILVLRGMGQGPNGMTVARDFAAGINAECCAEHHPTWMVHPMLFDRYKVESAPAFVVSKGEGNASDDFSIVYGDVGLAGALKFIAQRSRKPAVQAQAAAIYNKTFGSRY